MEAPFGFRELVEKRFQPQHSSTTLTELERFLFSASNTTNLVYDPRNGEDVSSFTAEGAVSLFSTIGAVPSGILLNNSNMYGGFVCFGGDSTAALTVEKMNANSSLSSSSSSPNSSTGAAVNNIIKGQWTAEEDRMLLKLVKQHGERKWSQIAKNLVGRIGKQCRERWHNHLRPDIKKETWTEEEEKLLVEAHQMYGNRWAEIARHIPGRSENSIKNHWNATKRSQNAKRKSKKKAGQGARSRSSILENYIQTMITKAPSASSTFEGGAHEIFSQDHHASSALDSAEGSQGMPSTQSVLNFSTGTEHVNTEKILGFSGFEDEDYLLSSEDTCALLATPEAPSLLFTEETDNFYQVPDDYFCSNVQLLSSEVPDSSNIVETVSGRGDMDLMEMVTWQMAQRSQSRQSTSTSHDTSDRRQSLSV